MATKRTVKELLDDEIKDLYSAETQLIKAIPKMAAGAGDTALKEALKAHLIETQGQVARLEEVATLLEIKPGGKKCMGMEGVSLRGRGRANRSRPWHHRCRKPRGALRDGWLSYGHQLGRAVEQQRRRRSSAAVFGRRRGG